MRPLRQILGAGARYLPPGTFRPHDNDRHYAVLGIPTVSCRSKYPVTDARTEEYVQALTDMIHQVADNDAPEPAKNTGQGEKAS
ncbi:MAG: hypothetical protein ACLT38_13650 [Akkermansia sp.]